MFNLNFGNDEDNTPTRLSLSKQGQKTLAKKYGISKMMAIEKPKTKISAGSTMKINRPPQKLMIASSTSVPLEKMVM